MSNAYKGYKLTKRSTNQFLKLIVIIFYNYDYKKKNNYPSNMHYQSINSIIHFFSMVVFTLAREEASWCTGVGCIRAWTRAYHRRCQKKKGLTTGVRPALLHTARCMVPWLAHSRRLWWADRPRRRLWDTTVWLSPIARKVYRSPPVQQRHVVNLKWENGK